MRRVTAVGGAAILVVVLATGAKACGSTPKASSAAVSPTTIAPVAATSAATSATAKAAPSTTAAPSTLLDVNGTGDKTTDPFTAKGAWHINYSYNCAAFGQAGDFGILVQGGDGFSDQGPNTQGMSGQDSNFEPQGGTFTLQIISECQWHVTVTG